MCDFCKIMLIHKHYTIPVFIPELACPFQCVFCNQKKISGHHSIPSGDEIIKIIDSHLRSFKRGPKTVEVGFFGGSFTGIPMENQIEFLKYVQPYIRLEKVNSIRISTRPDYINPEVLNVLKKYNVKTIELGAQSLDNKVLKESRRGHNVEDVEKASKMIIDHGFKLGLQMMIGLPGDSLDSSIKTANKIIELGADNTRIYPALVIKDTTLHTWYNEGKYTPLSLDEAIKWTSCILPLFENANIKVLRVGLHPSEGLISGSELIDGPFHPSFKELVLTEIWHNILIKETSKIDAKEIVVMVNPRELNYAIGYNSVNKNLLNEKFDKVRFVPDIELLKMELKILY